MNTAIAVIIENKEKPRAKTFLTSEVHQLILHTGVGQALFNAGWQIGRMGLVQFASLMTTLWEANNEDDPYAQLYLLRTSDAINQSLKKLKEYEIKLQQQLDNLRGIKINLFKHPSPPQYPMRFATPYAFMASVLVEQVDYVNRQLYTFTRTGLIPEINIIPRDLMREVQEVFKIARKWEYTGVKRKDIFEKNKIAQRAQALFGDIPPAILNHEIESKFLPKPKGYSYVKKTI